jgi:hypothetical protein
MDEMAGRGQMSDEEEVRTRISEFGRVWDDTNYSSFVCLGGCWLRMLTVIWLDTSLMAHELSSIDTSDLVHLLATL